MKSKVTLIASVLCILTLSACSQAEQKGDQPVSPSSSSSSTPPSTATDTTATKKDSANKEANSQSNAGEIYEGTITGVISDSMCGKDHTKMGATGKDPAACIAKCVAGGAKYVLVDSKGDSYALSDQEKAKALAAKSVTITGHIDPKDKSIHVHSIVSQ